MAAGSRCDSSMPRLLCRLNNVPDEEAQEIRELLAGNAIRFYETDAGFWRVGVDALWLPDDSQLDAARHLLADYQAQRSVQQQRIYGEILDQGQRQNFWQRLRAQPLRVLGLLVAIALVLGFSLLPFFLLMFNP